MEARIMKPKFQIGDKVIVCQDLVTTIKDIEGIEDGSYYYWFDDENGGRKWEYEHAIELYSSELRHKVYEKNS